jgi:hypothetical protein
MPSFLINNFKVKLKYFVIIRIDYKKNKIKKQKSKLRTKYSTKATKIKIKKYDFADKSSCKYLTKIRGMFLFFDFLNFKSFFCESILFQKQKS